MFINLLGSSHFSYKNLKSINSGFIIGYSFNSSIQGLDDTDLCLLVGSNIRFEAAVLNIRLRKSYLTGKLIKLGYIGSRIKLTYPITHIGTSLRTFISILEGKHSFCTELRNARKPLVIISSNILGYINENFLFNLLNNFINFTRLVLLNNNVNQEYLFIKSYKLSSN